MDGVVGLHKSTENSSIRTVINAKMGDEVNQIELCGENRNSGDHSNEAWKEGQHGVGEDEGGDGDSLYTDINGAGANCNCRNYLYGTSLQSV